MDTVLDNRAASGASPVLEHLQLHVLWFFSTLEELKFIYVLSSLHLLTDVLSREEQHTFRGKRKSVCVCMCVLCTYYSTHCLVKHIQMFQHTLMTKGNIRHMCLGFLITCLRMFTRSTSVHHKESKWVFAMSSFKLQPVYFSPTAHCGFS